MICTVAMRISSQGWQRKESVYSSPTTCTVKECQGRRYADVFALSHTQIYSEETRQKLRSTLIDWTALFIGATVREKEENEL